MTMRTPWVLSLLLATASMARAQDRIHLKSTAEPIEGEIVDLTCKEVRFLSDGSETGQAAREIRAIEFDAARCYDFADGVRKMKGDDFEGARDKFERALRDSQARKPLKQAARYFIVECTCEIGEYDKAIAAAKQLRADIPDTYYLRE
jgi:tetratricopeptide (TPR) repeat protein